MLRCHIKHRGEKNPQILKAFMKSNNLSLPPAPNSYVGALTPNVTVLGDRANKEGEKVKGDHKGGDLIQ